jgi:hypothetical protein
MLRVGIYGGAGFMGAPFSRALIRAHRANQLHLSILHRPESDLSRYPADIEKRCMDLERDEIPSITEKLTDLQVVM